MKNSMMKLFPTQSSSEPSVFWQSDQCHILESDSNSEFELDTSNLPCLAQPDPEPFGRHDSESALDSEIAIDFKTELQFDPKSHSSKTKCDNVTKTNFDSIDHSDSIQ